MRKSLNIILLLTLFSIGYAEQITFWNKSSHKLLSKEIDNFGMVIDGVPTLQPGQKVTINYRSVDKGEATSYSIFYVKKEEVMGVEFFHSYKDMIKVTDFPDQYTKVFYDLYKKLIIISDR